MEFLLKVLGSLVLLFGGACILLKITAVFTHKKRLRDNTWYMSGAFIGYGLTDIVGGTMTDPITNLSRHIKGDVNVYEESFHFSPTLDGEYVNFKESIITLSNNKRDVLKLRVNTLCILKEFNEKEYNMLIDFIKKSSGFITVRIKSDLDLSMVFYICTKNFKECYEKAVNQ